MGVPEVTGGTLGGRLADALPSISQRDRFAHAPSHASRLSVGRGVSELLATWRAADRELARAVQGSLEFAALEARIEALRTAYHQLFAERRSP